MRWTIENKALSFVVVVVAPHTQTANLSGTVFYQIWLYRPGIVIDARKSYGVWGNRNTNSHTLSSISISSTPNIIVNVAAYDNKEDNKIIKSTWHPLIYD